MALDPQVELPAELEGVDVSNPAKLDGTQRTALLPLVQVKPDGSADTWTQAEQDHFVAKGWRPPRPSEVMKVTATVRPTDYQHDLKRGTVDYDERTPNCAFCTVAIPDGTLVIGRNFAQAEPNTVAITGQNLHFVECNLGNVAIDPSWTLTDCNTVQSWIVDDSGRETRLFVCSHPSELKGDEKPPVNAILSRDF